MRETDSSTPLIKIVYFDEESASDLLDVAAGGKASTTSEQVKERAADVQSRAGVGVAAKFGWLSFLGGSAEASASAGASSLGRSIFNKTLSNTILTDYLVTVDAHRGVKRLEGLKVTAPQDSAAFMKMYTPYMALLKMEELPVNLAGLGDALEVAKGYYELVGEDADGFKCILRFNSKAFRNNYGLVDLGRMRLMFHGILVGRASEGSLTMAAEMDPNNNRTPLTVNDLLDEGRTRDDSQIDVYDVLLAGVEYVG